MEDFLSPEVILNNLEISENMTAVEFGCGAGIFVIALAKRIKQGRVYGLDVQEEKLSVLKSKALVEKLINIITIHCDLEAKDGSTLARDSADIVLIPNVLFQSENKYAIINEGKRILKQGGQLLIIDWQKSSLLAPKQGIVSPDEIKKIAREAELIFKKEFSAGGHHFALLFSK